MDAQKNDTTLVAMGHGELVSLARPAVDLLYPLAMAFRKEANQAMERARVADKCQQEARFHEQQELIECFRARTVLGEQALYPEPKLPWLLRLFPDRVENAHLAYRRTIEQRSEPKVLAYEMAIRQYFDLLKEQSAERKASEIIHRYRSQFDLDGISVLWGLMVEMERHPQTSISLSLRLLSLCINAKETHGPLSEAIASLTALYTDPSSCQ